jgi:hypothetical protein
MYPTAPHLAYDAVDGAFVVVACELYDPELSDPELSDPELSDPKLTAPMLFVTSRFFL